MRLLSLLTRHYVAWRRLYRTKCLSTFSSYRGRRRVRQVTQAVTLKVSSIAKSSTIFSLFNFSRRWSLVCLCWSWPRPFSQRSPPWRQSSALLLLLYYFPFLHKLIKNFIPIYRSIFLEIYIYDNKIKWIFQ